MLKKLKGKGKTLGLTLACLTLLSVPSLASMSPESYEAYELPRFCGNNYTNKHAKTTGSQFLDNKVTKLTDAPGANMWACNAEKDMVSKKVTFRSDKAYYKIKFNKRLNKGNWVRMGMENTECTDSRGFVSGVVYFY
ncbi:hypothetical protein [Clostridium botulinum]|nr:hypothetical protein [Clostridium botulinum]